MEGAPYLYVGRHRAHYKLIEDIMFGVMLDSDLPRLMSVGQDRFLVSWAGVIKLQKRKNNVDELKHNQEMTRNKYLLKRILHDV